MNVYTAVQYLDLGLNAWVLMYVQERNYGADWDQTIYLPVADMIGSFSCTYCRTMFCWFAWPGFFVPGMSTEQQLAEIVALKVQFGWNEMC